MPHFDLNVYLGYWPFRRLRVAGAAGVRHLMARTGVDQALAIPLQAVFYKDCLDGVTEMIEDIGPERHDLLPLAIVNPAFPGWEADLDRMIGELGCVGCGVLPNYHGYAVYDACACALFTRLVRLGLPALIFVRLWDERSHHVRMQVFPVSIDDVSYVLKTFPDLRVAVCNAILPSEGVALAAVLADRAPVLLTTAYKSLQLAQCVAQIGASHIAYASGAPLYYPESALFQVLDAEIDVQSRSAVLGGNARAFLGL